MALPGQRHDDAIAAAAAEAPEHAAAAGLSIRRRGMTGAERSTPLAG
jgi:hypothetical protein